ncbi:unnamed protein product, partial [Prorocentrum cordatum]
EWLVSCAFCSPSPSLCLQPTPTAKRSRSENGPRDRQNTFRPSPAVRCLGGALTPPRPPGPRGGRAPCPAERLLKGGGRHAGVAPRLAAVGTSSVTRRVRLGGQVPRPPQVVRKTSGCSLAGAPTVGGCSAP